MSEKSAEPLTAEEMRERAKTLCLETAAEQRELAVGHHRHRDGRKGEEYDRRAALVVFLADCIGRLPLLSAQSTAAAEWLPIETAPRDGTPLLLFARSVHATAPVRIIGWWLAEPYNKWVEAAFAPNGPVGIVPTHWQPLPEFPLSPPTAEGERPTVSYPHRLFPSGELVMAPPSPAEGKAMTAEREAFLRSWLQHRPHEPLDRQDVLAFVAALDAVRAAHRVAQERVQGLEKNLIAAEERVKRLREALERVMPSLRVAAGTFASLERNIAELEAALKETGERGGREMSEYFIVANSFAAPFFSDTSEHFIEADNPREALDRFAAAYSHPAGLYAAACYRDANAKAKGEKPLAKWICNHEREKQRLTEGQGSYSYYGERPGRFRINDTWHTVADPKGGTVLPSPPSQEDR